jgi:hypothetical protein
VGADQFALVAGEAVRAGGADLAVVVDGGFASGADLTLWKIRSNFIIKDMGSVGKHG